MLWVQQRVRDGSLQPRKVRVKVNPADLFMKHLSSEERVLALLRLFCCRRADGRAKGASQLRKDVGVSYSGILAWKSATTRACLLRASTPSVASSWRPVSGSPKLTSTMSAYRASWQA